MTPEQQATKLREQEAQWPRAQQAGHQGNAYATLCLHCYGRHAPPRDEICPHEPPPVRSRR